MKVFSKNRLFISLLSSSLSITFLVSPGYAMDDEGRRTTPSQQSRKNAARQQTYAQTQPQLELIAYMAPDKTHPHPRGEFRRLPQGKVFTCDLLNPQHVRWEA